MNYRRNKALALSLTLGALVAVPTQSDAMFKAFAAAAARMSTRNFVRPAVYASFGGMLLNIKDPQSPNESAVPCTKAVEQPKELMPIRRMERITKLRSELDTLNEALIAGATPQEPLKRTDIILKTIAKAEHEVSKGNNTFYNKQFFFSHGQMNDTSYYGPYSLRSNFMQHSVMHFDWDNRKVIHTEFDVDSTHPIAQELRNKKNTDYSPISVDDVHTKCEKVRVISLDNPHSLIRCTTDIPAELFNEKMSHYVKEFKAAEPKNKNDADRTSIISRM